MNTEKKAYTLSVLVEDTTGVLRTGAGRGNHPYFGGDHCR